MRAGPIKVPCACRKCNGDYRSENVARKHVREEKAADLGEKATSSMLWNLATYSKLCGWEAQLQNSTAGPASQGVCQHRQHRAAQSPQDDQRHQGFRARSQIQQPETHGSFGDQEQQQEDDAAGDKSASDDSNSRDTSEPEAPQRFAEDENKFEEEEDQANIARDQYTEDFFLEPLQNQDGEPGGEANPEAHNLPPPGLGSFGDTPEPPEPPTGADFQEWDRKYLTFQMHILMTDLM